MVENNKSDFKYCTEVGKLALEVNERFLRHLGIPSRSLGTKAMFIPGCIASMIVETKIKHGGRLVVSSKVTASAKVLSPDMSVDIQKWKAEAHENAAKTVANMLQVFT